MRRNLSDINWSALWTRGWCFIDTQSFLLASHFHQLTWLFLLCTMVCKCSIYERKFDTVQFYVISPVTYGYALQQCVRESVLGALVAFSAIVGIFGSITFPLLRKRLNVTRFATFVLWNDYVHLVRLDGSFLLQDWCSRIHNAGYDIHPNHNIYLLTRVPVWAHPWGN